MYAVLLLASLVSADPPKPATLTSSDLTALFDMKHEKHKEAVEKHNGQIIKLYGSLSHRSSFVQQFPQDNFHITIGTKLFRIYWNEKTTDLESLRKKLSSGPIQITVYGKLEAKENGIPPTMLINLRGAAIKLDDIEKPK